MDEIRPVSLNDIDEVARIAAMAYPGSNLLGTEGRQQFAERVKSTLENDPNVSYHGCYRDGQLVGIMKWYDFSMYVYGQSVLTGGIGTVAVDLLHKKEKVAKTMLHGFLAAYRERGIPLVSLYPFRVDFYKQMGFGTGSKIHQYKFKPASLPYTGKDQIVYVTKEDKEQVLACYQRVARQTHGMIKRTERDVDSLLNVPEKIVVGVRQEDKLTGYLAFQFESAHEENKIFNNIVVKELVYESREALAQLLSFLHSQADQIQRVVLNTADEDFHLLLSDPGNGTNRLLPSVYHESHVSGVGLMYRVIDVPGFFRQMGERHRERVHAKAGATGSGIARLPGAKCPHQRHSRRCGQAAESRVYVDVGGTGGTAWQGAWRRRTGLATRRGNEACMRRTCAGIARKQVRHHYRQTTAVR